MAVSATPDATPSRLTLVAGTGRSGTSTLVGLLRRHGLHVPRPEVPADDSNPRGFGEPQWVVDLHDELLARAHVQVADARPEAWSRAAGQTGDEALLDRVGGWLGDHLGSAERLVVKDPRLLWFLPLWTSAAAQRGVAPVFATMLRPPAEVVGSRRAHYNRGLDDTHGVAAWLNLALGTERATRGSRRAFVRYHDLIDDWRPVLDRLDQELGLRLGPGGGGDAGEFVDPGLRRVRLTWDDLALPRRLEDLARRTWDALDLLADEPASRAGTAELDGLRAEYDEYYAESEAVARSSLIAARSAPRGPSGVAATGGPGRGVPGRLRARARSWLAARS